MKMSCLKRVSVGALAAALSLGPSGTAFAASGSLSPARFNGVYQLKPGGGSTGEYACPKSLTIANVGDRIVVKTDDLADAQYGLTSELAIGWQYIMQPPPGAKGDDSEIPVGQELTLSNSGGKDDTCTGLLSCWADNNLGLGSLNFSSYSLPNKIGADGKIAGSFKADISVSFTLEAHNGLSYQLKGSGTAGRASEKCDYTKIGDPSVSDGSDPRSSDQSTGAAGAANGPSSPDSAAPPAQAPAR